MPADFTVKKRTIVVVLSILIAADIGLALYSWDLSSSPRTPQKVFDQTYLQLKLLRGDIKNAESIKNSMPATRQDCDKFERSLPEQSTGYSAFVSELNDVAKKSGLQIVALTAKQKPVEKRGLEEVSVDATVNGEYGSVVRFVNGLQRSLSFCIVDGLALSADSQQKTTGAIRVALHLRTYFREAA